MRRILPLLIVLVTAAPAAADPVVQVAESGTLRAEFSFDREGDNPPVFTNLVLRISDGGRLVRTEHVADGYAPGRFEGPSVFVADYDRDGTPEVLLDVYTGGAHCCLESLLFDGTRRIRHEWRDAFYEPVERGGLTWFRSSDAYFAYAYGAFAYSRLPIKVFRYVDGAFKDVTTAVAWRRDVVADRKLLLDEYARVRPRHRGLTSQQILRATLAAAAADDCSLGHCATGIDRIRAAVRRGEINRYGSRKRPPGASFLHDVRRDLRVAGYLR
jgi:hypothetical protein